MNILKKIIAVFAGNKKPEQTYESSSHHPNVKKAAAPPARTLEKFRLIWLHSDIDKIAYVDTINQLQKVVNVVNPFTNADECIDFITNTKDKKIFMVISEAFSQVILNPIIQDNRQVFYIYIFPGNEDQHKQWPKVKGVYKDVTSICEAITLAIQESDRNSISISYVDTSHRISRTNLDELDQSFMYTQILKGILLTIDFKPKHISDFIEYYREQVADNDVELRKVEKLEREYGLYRPIRWYTYNGTLYAMVNKALRAMEADLIIILGFFVQHLHRDIAVLHSEQYNKHTNLDPFFVYRGQGLSIKDFEQLQKTENGLFAFNNFLSTSLKEEVARAFAESNSTNDNMIGVVFKMTIDPSNPSTCFANISGVSNFDEEEEILFSMHSIFRIGTATQLDEDGRLWQVNLTLTTDNDEQLNDLTKCIREEIKEPEGWLRLGRLMIRLGNFNEAEELCKKLLKETIHQNEAANLLNLLGIVKCSQGEYTEAYTLYRESITLKQNIQSLTDLNWAESFNNLGHLYRNIGQYAEALSFYELVLGIYQENSSSTDFDLALAYYNIGLVYDKMNKYKEQVSYYDRALEFISLMYFPIDAYKEQVFYYDKALELMTETLPPNHPNLAVVHCNKNNVLTKSIIINITDEQCKEKLLAYERIFETQKKILPPNHPDFAVTYNNIGRVFEITNKYDNAMLFYKKALSIQQNFCLPNHLDLALTYCNIGRTLNKLEEYSEARSFLGKALVIQEKILPPNHPDVIDSTALLASVYHHMKNYSRSVLFYQYAVDMAKRSMSKDDLKLAKLQSELEFVEIKLNFRGGCRRFRRQLFAYIRSPSCSPIIRLFFFILFLYWFFSFKSLCYIIAFYILSILFIFKLIRI
jgi:tetratricopeptide (TPR) repeat protein